VALDRLADMLLNAVTLSADAPRPVRAKDGVGEGKGGGTASIMLNAWK
jgi:hypothetical protein